jgi:hypothetical protein
MTTAIQVQAIPRKITLGAHPEQGPALAELIINFNTDTQFIKEFFQEQASMEIDFIQSIYIDNSASANAVTIAVLDTLYSITVKSHTQGWYPLPVQEGKARISFTRAATENTNLNLIFSNSMMPYVNWATQ